MAARRKRSNMSVTSPLTKPRKSLRNLPSVDRIAAVLLALLLPAGFAHGSSAVNSGDGCEHRRRLSRPLVGVPRVQSTIGPSITCCGSTTGSSNCTMGSCRDDQLADYRLPYWPIRSCVSVVSGGAELPHVPNVRYTAGGQEPHAKSGSARRTRTGNRWGRRRTEDNEPGRRYPRLAGAPVRCSQRGSGR